MNCGMSVKSRGLSEVAVEMEDGARRFLVPPDSASLILGAHRASFGPGGKSVRFGRGSRMMGWGAGLSPLCLCRSRLPPASVPLHTSTLPPPPPAAPKQPYDNSSSQELAGRVSDAGLYVWRELEVFPRQAVSPSLHST
ncbi:hypothetical protein E2C01_059779 [Portunus trituberculatus]|uniref:Uncharacterized protein n=1 Tax=Portunus trituberculatus TaxID=210409 RepID=A0A5B7GZC7_PORTR|nr:hypothetical protein [Portunus trituberculatus]